MGGKRCGGGAGGGGGVLTGSSPDSWPAVVSVGGLGVERGAVC